MDQTNIGTMFKLFSVAFEPPSIELAKLVASGTLQNDMQITWESLNLPPKPMDSFVSNLIPYVGRDEAEVMHELRRDATRLFVADRPLVANTEGVWRKRAEGKTNAVLVINSYSLEVADFMRSCGVVRTQGYNDCVDYIETECDFAAFLATAPDYLSNLGKDPKSLLDDFIENHIRLWVPGFCLELMENSNTVYYKQLGGLMGEYIKEL